MHHGASFANETKDLATAEHLKHAWRDAMLSEQDKAICEYVEKLALRPGDMVEDDVARLRRAGFEDRGVLDINLVCSLFSFFNRLVDGLGVEVEPEMNAPSEKYR